MRMNMKKKLFVNGMKKKMANEKEEKKKMMMKRFGRTKQER